MSEGIIRPFHDGMKLPRTCSFTIRESPNKPFTYIYCPTVNLTSPGSYLKVSMKEK